MKNRVLYVRDDGTLLEQLEKKTASLRKRTGGPVSMASVARRLLAAALASPRICRDAGVG